MDPSSRRYAGHHRRPQPHIKSSGFDANRGRGRREEFRQQLSSTSKSSSTPMLLVTNAFRLGLKRPGIVVHEYQLNITIARDCKNISCEVLGKNFVSKSIRELVIQDIVPKLVDNRESCKQVVIELGLKAIYSIERFKIICGNRHPRCGFSADNPEELYIFENLPVQTDLLSHLSIDIEMKFSRTISLDSMEKDPNLMVSILNHQLLLNLLRFGSVYYLSHNSAISSGVDENRLDLISQHAMGIALSGIRRCSLDLCFVVVSCTHSYITKSHRLLDLLVTFIHGRPSRDLSGIKVPEIASITGKEEWFQSFCSILNGFKCQAVVLGKRINLRFSLTCESASSLKLDGIQPEITVEECYKKNDLTLKYPNLPCLKSRSTSHPYIPLETCHLLANQKVPIFRLSTTARNHLIQLNKPKPENYKHSSERARDKIVQENEVQFKSFGLEMNATPLKTQASMLQKPILKYRNRSIEPIKDFWESGMFFEPAHLADNWCVVDTVRVSSSQKDTFFSGFSQYCRRVGLQLGRPQYIEKLKQSISDNPDCLDPLVDQCMRLTDNRLRFIMFIIDSSSTALNRLIHLSFDERPQVTAACLRADSILNQRNHRSIYRTLVHKLNARLGGTNFIFQESSLSKSSNFRDIMVIGLDVTHPDNELNGVSIVGCAYTYSTDLFKHRSLVWPQAARVEIIGRMDHLVKKLLNEFYTENNNLPKHIIIYRDGVSHEEFDKVRFFEVSKALEEIETVSLEKRCPKPALSYMIAQKRHTMRFFRMSPEGMATNPPSGTLIDQDVVMPKGGEFYLYSNTSPQATARPIHYHVLTDGLGIEFLQKLTYHLCFNYGKCSGTLSMPSSLRYAHNAAYDARNRVIASREFNENKFYISKFFC